jgi:hypothetical protein
MKQVTLLVALVLLNYFPQPSLSQQGQKNVFSKQNYEYCVLKTTSNTSNWKVSKLFCGCLRDLINNEKKSRIEASQTCGEPLGIIPDMP